MEFLKEWFSSPVTGWGAAIIALFIILFIVDAFQNAVRFLAHVFEWGLIFLGTGIAYFAVKAINGSNWQVLGVAIIAGLVVGLLTIPLMPFKKERDRQQNKKTGGKVQYDWGGYYWKSFCMARLDAAACLDFIRQKRQDALNYSDQKRKVEALLVCTDLTGDLLHEKKAESHSDEVLALHKEILALYHAEHQKLQSQL